MILIGDDKMYLRNQGVFVVDKFENIPFDIIETSNQIIIMEDKDNHEEFSRTRTLILDSKINVDNRDIHISFEEHEVTSNYRTNDSYCYEGDEKPSIRSSYARSEKQRYETSYIKLINGELFQIDSDLAKRNIADTKESNKEVYESIHSYCFSNSYRMFGSNNFIFKEDENAKFFNFISLKMTENLQLVLLVEDTVNPKNKLYKRHESSFFFHKDGTYFRFETNFNELISTLERVYCELNEYMYRDYFAKFKELLQKTAIKDISDFVVLDKYNRTKFIKELKNQLFKTYSSMKSNTYDDFEDLFKPIHVDNEVEFFSDSTYGYTRDIIVVKNNEILNKKNNKSNEEKDIVRVGYAIRSYEQFGEIGISPYDGQYYDRDKNTKQLIDKTEQYVQYKDFEGLILNSNYAESHKYYVKIAGYYIQADATRDKEALDDLKERKRVVDALDRAL